MEHRKNVVTGGLWGILLWCLCVFIPSVAAGPSPLFLQRHDSSFVVYYLEHASLSAPSPVLLLVLQGSDCNSVTHNPRIRDDARQVWPSADLLTIEKFGIDAGLAFSDAAVRADCPPSFIERDNPEQRVFDAMAVLDHVQRAHPYEKIVVMGGSEGAVIAALLAARLDTIDAVVMLNGGGRWFRDDVLYSMTVGPESADERSERQKEFGAFADQVLSQPSFDLNVSDHGYGWWRQFLEIDLQKTLAQINEPLLIVQGQRDESVDPAAARAMVEALKKSSTQHIDYMTYDALDHSFKDKDGQSHFPEIARDVNLWLQQILN